jgi:RHS repeat-associated protein
MGYFRDNVEAMKGYEPGFQPKQADVVKLNTNENPYPPSPKVMAALAGLSAERLRRYPDPLGEEFRVVATEVNGVPADHIMCCNGGDELLTIAFRAFCDEKRPAAYPVPTYSLYPVLARLQDCEAVEIPFDEEFNLPANLVGYWKLDENAADTDVADSSGQGNDGTASQNTSLFHTDDAKIGTGAFEFDGDGDYVNCGHNSSLDLTESITISAWVKPTTGTDGDGFVIAKRTINSDEYGYNMYFDYAAGDKKICLFDGATAKKDSGLNYTIDEWQHVVFVINSAGTSFKAYKDGTSGSDIEMTKFDGPDTVDLYIGSRSGGSESFHGLIDDVMVINAALSDIEVETLFEGFTVNWDLNGNIATNDAGNDITYTFNWDNKLRKAIWNTSPEDSIEIKYDPMGNRVYKKSTASGSATEHKYIVDITGKLPVILMDLNLTDSSLKKKYIYADRQILAQHDIDDDAQPAQDDKYFYLHDRLGSVRLVINDSGSVVSHYTYEPFGEVIDDDVTFVNDFLFTGQYFDFEIEEYYLRARQYNPGIARFTSRDPAGREWMTPLTLQRYLYCENDPLNRVDPTGRLFWNVFGAISAGTAVHSAAIATVAEGVWYDNDMLIDAGIEMEYYVAPAMLFGTIMGPLLPEVPGAVLKMWEGATAMAGTAYAGAHAMADAISYWAITHLSTYEIISTCDAINQFSGALDFIPPVTPAGWVAKFYTWSEADSD